MSGECKECKSARKKTEKYREQNKKVAKARYVRKKEHIKQIVNEYRLANAEAISQRRKEKYSITEVKLRKKEYDKKRRLERTAEYVLMRKRLNQSYIARKNKCESTLTKAEYQECLNYFNYADAYTGLPMKTESQDHVIPLSKGGGYTKKNIIPCDRAINASKCNSDMETWYRKQPFFSEERLEKINQWMSNP